MGKSFTRADIIAMHTAPTPIEIPDWDATFYLRKWTAQERSDFLVALQIPIVDGVADTSKLTIDTINVQMSQLVALTLCDEHGKRLYSTSEEDLAELNMMEADVLTALYTASAKLNGLQGEAAVKEELKNSEATPKSDSTSS